MFGCFHFMFILSIFMFVLFRYRADMHLSPRQTDILTRARDMGRVTVDGLAAEFHVTAQTIRRDLGSLCDAGLLERTHGGAAMAEGLTNLAYMDRRRMNAEAKDAIGRAAARLVHPGNSVFLNIGTTTEAVARHLREVPNITVITNNLNVAQILSGHATAEVIVTSGRLRRSDGALVGELAVQTLRHFKPDLAMIGTSAIDHKGVLLDYDPDEIRVTHAILEQTGLPVLVADQGKFQRTAPVRVTNITRMRYWVTDRAPTSMMQTLCRGAYVRMFTPAGEL